MPTFETCRDLVGANPRQRLGMTLMLIRGTLALALAAIGIYDVPRGIFSTTAV